MSVGITVSYILSLARFDRYYFPGFSVIDTLVSLKALIISTYQSGSKRVPSISGSYNKIIQLPSYYKSEANSKKLEGPTNLSFTKIGDIANIIVSVDANSDIEIDRLGRIRV